MAASLLITLREGLEAALIIGIILAYLAKTGNRDKSASIWWGTLGAAVLSVLVGAIIFLTAGSFDTLAQSSALYAVALPKNYDLFSC